ncbi:uncharacterized protein LOC116140273 isoform X2 [Pistacia vera]|uniref:uncharacterized protein LOC116140273 isoform X2 n=1 Tax=Pistacia vera TaxID=55513 RepID=UPI0012639504|nr:uncharacterized protein LOC116140273 isoform X2 [Pistacia vera]
MLENPSQAATAPADSAPVIKRYAPPNQRSRPLNRRKSGGFYGNDGEKNQLATSRNNPVIDHGDAGSSALLNDYSRPKLIPLEGFCRSEAAQLLRDRGRAVMNRYHDTSIDLSERPVLYSSGPSAWGQFRLPHQMMSAANSIGTSGTHMDFLAELRRKMQSPSASFDN